MIKVRFNFLTRRGKSKGSTMLIELKLAHWEPTFQEDWKKVEKKQQFNVFVPDKLGVPFAGP
jgi:hypothetical protein